MPYLRRWPNMGLNLIQERNSNMYMITRKKGDEVIIKYPGQPDVRIIVRDVRNKQIRLAFDAPETVSIVRSETMIVE